MIAMGFFRNVGDAWNIGQLESLDRRFSATILAIDRAADAVKVRAFQTIVQRVSELGERIELSNVSADGHRAIARALFTEASASFDLDMGKGYGLVIVGTFLDAKGLSQYDSGALYQRVNEYLMDMGRAAGIIDG